MREKSRLLDEGNVVAMILNREKQIGSSRYLDSPAGEMMGENNRRTGPYVNAHFVASNVDWAYCSLFPERSALSRGPIW